ncbi:LapA family protein [Wenzhouxiangella sp. XN24]|uniref:lipopolysaccharide assembly protein LapA domain-containing protein n=1 Tax=Wenzhouxiangella sp. XN24 TaxID=2713569 RepID=UPI0013EC9AC3|nr:LapA family protein [Wenzhouxiangella sp. XN24]NGX16458.1 LapA family protein [Wenzhouxiangella sp. XN24]
MIKRILTGIILLAAVAASAFFTSLNPGTISLDVGFAQFQAPLGLAFVLALAFGWLLGTLSAILWIARIAADRRRLRRQLDHSPAETALQVRDERG